MPLGPAAELGCAQAALSPIRREQRVCGRVAYHTGLPAPVHLGNPGYLQVRKCAVDKGTGRRPRGAMVTQLCRVNMHGPLFPAAYLLHCQAPR